MTMPLWVSEAAEAFWAAAGGPAPLPRDLRVPIANALPLAVVLLPRLRVATVDAWLQRQGIACRPAVGDRPLRACLVARYGHGFVFLEGADPADELRYSLAHELAHFLRDYQWPRREAAERLGPAALEVLDGERPPRPEERIHALLARRPIGFHIHLMERASDGAHGRAAIDVAERDADLLACELLAPATAVLAGLPPATVEQRRDAIVRRLVAACGLPEAPARRYAALLVPEPRQPDSLLRRLGLVP